MNKMINDSKTRKENWIPCDLFQGKVAGAYSEKLLHALGHWKRTGYHATSSRERLLELILQNYSMLSGIGSGTSYLS